MKTHTIVTTDLAAPSSLVRRWHLPTGEVAESEETTFETGTAERGAKPAEYAPRHRAA